MQIFDLLGQDHREILGLLDQLVESPEQAAFDASGRAYLVDHLVAVASRHEAAEEMVFWPQVRKRLGARGNELADTALAQEADGKALLDLLRFTADEETTAIRGQELAATVKSHASFEEMVVWPEMRKVTTGVWGAITAMKFRAARRTGPTRPHPNGPDRPLRLVTVGAPAVFLDHARDLMTRRRSGVSRLAENSPDQADAVTVLTSDHARVGRLLSALEAHPDPDDRTVAEAVREWSIHDAVERQYLYPRFYERLEDGAGVHEDSVVEHGRIAKLAADIRAYPVHDEPRRELIAAFIAAARAHIEQEEAGPLPALAARMTHEELVELGRLLQAGRAKAPTRPHPHSGDSGLAAKISGRLAAPFDKARDAVSGRGSS